MIATVLTVGLGATASWAQGSGAALTTADPFTVAIPPEPASLRRRLRFQQLDRESGLPQNTVSSIVQDETGFVWMGTGDGLARYDGQRFLTFRHDPDDPTSLSASFVNTLLLARDGTLWVGTEGGGVNRYLPQEGAFERFMAKDGADTLNSGSISALSEGPDGRIWIATIGGGLAVLDPETGAIRSYSMEDGLPPVVSSVIAADDGTVWVGTGAGVYRRDADGSGFQLLFHASETLKSAVISDLHLDRSGALWIGTDGNGLARFTPASESLQIYRADADDRQRLADDSITAVHEDRDGRMWIGTQKALHILDPETGRFERHAPDSSHSMSLPGRAMDIYEDAAGVLWVGTFGGGAALLDARSLQFGFYKTPGATAMFLDGEDLWVGSSENLCRWRGTATLEGVCYETGFPTSILVDRSGAVWVGTMTDGLLRLDPGSTDEWTVYQHDPDNPRSIAPGPVVRLYEDRAGRIWLGSLGGGLQRWDRQADSFVQYELPFNIVYTIQGDPKRDDLLWLGTADQGLASLHIESGQVDLFTPNPDDPDTKTDNAVVDFVFEGETVVWLATFGGGLKRLDRTTRTFETFRRPEGMPSDTLYAVLRDAAGSLWLSSLAGLARFDPETRETHVFGSADGLQSVEFAMGIRVAADDGRFFFGGINGFNVFRPDQIEIDRYQPPLVITAIDVLGEPYANGVRAESIDRLDLAYDEGFVNIEFAALSYSGSDQLQFEYKLEGINDRWFSSNSASVSLTGLEDGEYTLLLRARNRHGVESEPIALAIHVAPPPWRTWWAYLAYGFTFLALILSLYRYQKARIDRLQKLARLATVEREFEVTAAVQSWFLPESVAHQAGVCDLFGFYRGAEKCSGDWWWYEDLGDGKLWVIVADVTGHGAGPAMLTAAVAMGLSVQSDDRANITERLERVNREVLLRCKGKATMTMTAIVLDQNTGEGVIYGLGGLPALLMEPGGKHRVIGASGTPLGSVETLSIGERDVRLGPGERLLITTDGVVETVMDNGRQLGLRRFVNIMRDVKEAPLPLAVGRIVQGVDLARGAQPQDDDFTFCVIERHG